MNDIPEDSPILVGARTRRPGSRILFALSGAVILILMVCVALLYSLGQVCSLHYESEIRFHAIATAKWDLCRGRREMLVPVDTNTSKDGGNGYPRPGKDIGLPTEKYEFRSESYDPILEWLGFVSAGKRAELYTRKYNSVIIAASFPGNPTGQD